MSRSAAVPPSNAIRNRLSQRLVKLTDRTARRGDAVVSVERETLDDPIRRLVRGGMLNLAGAAVFGVGSFAFFVIAARSLPADQAGALLEAIAVFIMLIWIGSLGTPVGFVRALPRARTFQRVAELAPTALVALVPVAVCSTLLGLGVFFAAPELAPLIARRSAPETMTTSLRVVGLLAPFGAVLTAVLGATQGLGTMVPANVIDNLAQPVARLLLVLGVAAGVTNNVYVPLTWTLPAVAGALLALVWLRALIRRLAAERGGVPARPAWNIAREFWSFTSLRGLATVLQMTLIWLDVLLVGALASASDAGTYALASRYLIAGSLINTALINILSPELSTAFAQNRLADVKRLYAKATLWVMAASLPLYLLMAIYASLLVDVFGPSYEPGAHALLVLSLAMCITVTVGPVLTVLLMGGKNLWNLVDISLALVINIVGNILLVPRYGITGAAIAFAASILFFNFVPLGQIFLLWRVHPIDRSYPVLLGLCIFCFGLLPLALRLSLGATPGAFVASIAVGALLYAVGLRFLRPLVDLGSRSIAST